MTRYFFILLVLIAVLLLTKTSVVMAWNGTVVKVIDGDSLRVSRGRSTVDIRLYGIDCPEYRQPFSNKARKFAKRLVYSKQVEVEEMDRDRYGRIVALVTADKMLLNRELVRAGLAWHYPRYCRVQPLCGEMAALEQSARRAESGLWGDSEPLPPWEWKRQQRKAGSEGAHWYDRFLDWWR